MQLSVVCPFFNEEKIIDQAVRNLLDGLYALGMDFELIVVNDGSTDTSVEIAREIAEVEKRLIVESYRVNRGRGYALRRGIAIARGEIVVTTEIDLSWGEDIVGQLYKTLTDNPACDIVVASPNLPGGGYRNVPLRRVIISRFGNWIIRACMTNAVTMNTGMTRGYRRHAIQSLPLEEDGKEFHLEVILKAQSLRFRICEIPCILEWKDYKHRGKRVSRKSSSKVNKLIVSHTLFSLFANPIRYVWALSVITGLLSVGFAVAGIIFFLQGVVAIYSLLISLTLAIIGLIFFALGVIAYQGNAIQRELWALRRENLLRSREKI